MLLFVLCFIHFVCDYHFTTSFHINKWVKSFKSNSMLMTSSGSIETDLIGKTLYCNLVGFGVELLNPCIKLNDKSSAVFFNGMESLKPGFWRVIEDKNSNIATIEITHPVKPEYLLFFDIWETSILWKGEIDLKNMDLNNLKLTNGKVLTNKKRFGIIPYVDTLGTFDAKIYNNDEEVPKAILPKFSKQNFLAPEDFDSPYDMKRYPQYFDPEYVEYFFAVEEALAKNEQPPLRPKPFFVPTATATDDESSTASSNSDESYQKSKKGFKVSKK